MMLLTLDIGNSNIKSASFNNNHLRDFRVHSDIYKAAGYINQLQIEQAAICSVNPNLLGKILKSLEVKAVPFFIVNYTQNFNLIIDYKTPETLGMDRLCAAVGALEIAIEEKLFLCDSYLITIDFGTATTINIISPEKKFIGGLISPGIYTMLKSLNRNTAQLPIPNLQSYEGLVGQSTKSSIASGVLTATVGMINETINKLKSDADKNPIIFVTGGNAKFILPYIHHKLYFDEALVLKGLKIIYDLNN